MTHRTFILSLLLIVTTVDSMAQADRTLSSVGQSYAVPGGSAVGFSAPQPLSSGALAPTFISRPATSQASSASAFASKKQEGKVESSDEAIVSHDSIYYGPAGYWDYPAAPYRGYGGLHQGLNMSVGMSVFAQFGKHARKGAGFTQSIDATWLQPLGRRAWLAVGGYIDHTNWSGDSYTTGGLYGELGYQIAPSWSAYVYGRKELVNNGYDAYTPMGYGYYGMYGMPGYDVGDKLGAAVRWAPNEKFSLQLSVEKNWWPRSKNSYMPKFKYSDAQTENKDLGIGTTLRNAMR